MTRRARFWQGLIQEWEQGQQTQRTFCQQRGVNVGTFAWWRRHLRARPSSGRESTRARQPGPSSSAAFVEIVRPAAPLGAAYEIVLASGTMIRVPGTFEAGALSRLIAAVACACEGSPRQPAQDGASC